MTQIIDGFFLLIKKERKKPGQFQNNSYTKGNTKGNLGNIIAGNLIAADMDLRKDKRGKKMPD